MNGDFWWYVARSGGIVAWALATASVLWGLLLSSRVLGRRVALPKLLDLHRFLGGLCLVFAGVHMVGLLSDRALGLGLADVLIPFASDWEPGAVAWGVVAFYLLVAVEVTSLLRSSVGERLWKKVHYAGFAVFLFGTIHGLRVGTDVRNPLIWWPAAVAAAGVVGLCAYRIFAGDEMRLAPRSERVPTALLERTLSELERLDTGSYPPAPTPAPFPVFEPLSEFSLRPQARPSIPPPPPPPVEPAAPTGPPVPSRAPAGDGLLAHSLPTRTPQRLRATTEPAALGVWTPATRSVHEDTSGPPPPPDAVDPSTGEPDPQAYRRWLREWLSYVESQP